MSSPAITGCRLQKNVLSHLSYSVFSSRWLLQLLRGRGCFSCAAAADDDDDYDDYDYYYFVEVVAYAADEPDDYYNTTAITTRHLCHWVPSQENRLLAERSSPQSGERFRHNI